MQSQRHRHRAIVCVIAIVAVLVLGIVPGIRVRAAATYFANVTFDGFSVGVVDCSSQSNTDCTLREAITAANANPGADTVTLISNAGYSLTLNPAAGDDNKTGDLNITDSVTIAAANGASAVIDASAMLPTRDRVLTVSSGLVSLTNITFIGGSASGGGGIANTGTLTLNRCVVSGNTSSTNGGGIVNTGPGQLTLNTSLVGGTGTRENTAAGSGGGIANSGSTGTVALINSQVLGNRSNGTPPSSAGGGGIFNSAGGQLLMTASNLRQNTTSGAGGGIFNIDAGSQTTVAGGIIADNQSDDGGGIRNANGTTHVTDALIAGNTLTNVFSGFGNGGGVSNDGALTLTRTTISGNSAAVAAGGVGNGNGSVTLQDSTITGNSALLGGGIQNFFPGRTITLTGTTVSQNVAINGDGGGIRNLGTLNVTDSAITGNTAAFNGGGISNNDLLTLTHATVSSNSAGAAAGGVGNGVGGTGTMTIVDSTIAGNTAGFGGGLQNFIAGATVTMMNTTVTGNHATTGNGGGVRNFGTFNATNSTFSGNTANNGLGGGITYVGTVTLRNVTIAGNSTGINNSGGTLTLKNGLIGGNTNGDCTGGTIPSGDYNLASDASCSQFTQLHDRTDVNPLLAPLGAYGGVTQTHALLPGSPAIDAGDDVTCAGVVGGVDQRGVSRSAGGAHCDIGAFESRGFTLTVTGGSGQSVGVGSPFLAPLALHVTSVFEPVAGGVVTFTAPGAGATLSSNTAVVAPDGNVAVHATANGTAGTYAVVASAGGAMDASYTLSNLPTITFVSPASGSTAGGNVVTLIGAGFGTPANAQVLLDGVPLPATAIAGIIGTQIVYTAPAHNGGTVAVAVVTNGVTSATKTYTYGTQMPLPPPVVPGNPSGSPQPLPNGRPAASAASGGAPAPLPSSRP